MRILLSKGSRYLERDCVMDNGYADKVLRSFQGSIEVTYEHVKFPEVGRERFFRINLEKYFDLKNNLNKK